jgi:peptidyl-prolyl cis-trans isomerase C
MTMAIDPSSAAPVAESRSLSTVSALRARVPPRLVALASHRLVQFAVLGGLIFTVAPRPASPRSIDVRSERLGALVAVEMARDGARRGATATAHEVEQRALEDEILFREGVRLGLDRNDGIVRQRVVQKVLFLAEEIGGASRPAREADLRAFFEKNKERWTIPERFHLTQVFSHRREALVPPASATDPAPRGEPGPVPPEFEGSRAQVVAAFGAPFADALAGVPEGVWSGPVASVFGWHLVRITGHTPARPARFEEVRAPVTEADSVFRRQEAVARFVESAFARYHVTLDGEQLRAITPTRRVAYRSVSSGED